MTPGDIVLIRFPRTDLQAGKLRPALVVALVPGRHNDWLLAAISSRLYQAIAGLDEVIYPTDADFSQTRLRVASVIRASRLATVEDSVFDARLGRLSTERLHRVRAQIAGWLQAPPVSQRMSVVREASEEWGLPSR
jgi:mRNA interferase MazF